MESDWVAQLTWLGVLKHVVMRDAILWEFSAFFLTSSAMAAYTTKSTIIELGKPAEINVASGTRPILSHTLLQATMGCAGEIQGPFTRL